MSSSGKFRMGDGDWVCSDSECANVNFARRTSCNKCGKDKPPRHFKKKMGAEIGKAAAEKSHGLFSADDWQCTKCGNINWSRRHTCNMCNAPKVGDVEERTGYGGGYNERDNVEYVRRDSDSDEYDEFGRKKKKFRGYENVKAEKISDKKEVNAKAEKISDNKEKESNDKDDEEEEEEEDDDEDISKYDLSGWGDEDDEEDDEDISKYDLSESNDKKESESRCRSKKSNTRSRSRSPIQNY